MPVPVVCGTACDEPVCERGRVMALGKAQRGVLAGMLIGWGASLLLLAATAWYVEPDTGTSRFEWLALALVLPALSLMIAIARLAKHRFFTPQDIDGSALTVGTERARLLQSLLQNTLEQLGLAVPVYAAWAALAPFGWLPTLPASACLFLLGRLLFFHGYARGAAARSFGFALTFYPTIMLLLGALVVAVQKIVG